MLLRELSELACDEMAQTLWQESEQHEADNTNVGPLTAKDLQTTILESSDDPF